MFLRIRLFVIILLLKSFLVKSQKPLFLEYDRPLLIIIENSEK